MFGWEARAGSEPVATSGSPPQMGSTRGWGSSVGDVVVGGETKFIGRVAEPPSTGFPSPQHRLLTFGIAGESSTRDGRSLVPLIGTGDSVPARPSVGAGDSTTRHGWFFDAAHRHR